MSLSATALMAALADSTDEQFVLLVELSHSNFSTLRFCSDTQLISHQGDDFTPLDMDVEFPQLGDSGTVNGELVLDNVTDDGEPVASLRSADSPIDVRLIVVLASAPDTIQVDYTCEGIPEGRYDATHFRLGLGYSTVLGDSYPQRTFNPNDTRGLF